MASGIVTSSADRIVEQGTQSLNNQTWTYRKYESGVCEAWAIITTSSISGTGDIHSGAYSFPSFFISITGAFITGCFAGIVNSYLKYSGTYIGSKTVEAYVYKGSSESQPMLLRAHIMGTWK